MAETETYRKVQSDMARLSLPYEEKGERVKKIERPCNK